jgi:acyl CoA:acetate/3-ketoacid CoA transferase
MKAVSAEEAVAMIANGATVMIGGFMGVGTPERRRSVSGMCRRADRTALPPRFSCQPFA